MKTIKLLTMLALAAVAIGTFTGCQAKATTSSQGVSASTTTQTSSK